MQIKKQSKAARPCPSPRAQKSTTKPLRLEKLISERASLERQARDAALAAAESFYKCSAATLREVVFANWLDQHAFNQKFQPMQFITI
ncbi:MAG TPA: hypothetical protein VFY06_15580 [Verrucomicrobiae bacterium]|nr:hypothetical protein [Verrucomicrobiae bacterium]